jgi:carbamoyltransferase
VRAVNIIVGLHNGPDAAACVLVDGTLRAAAEEERFRRRKHWAGFPEEALRYCLREAGVRLSEVASVAVGQTSLCALDEIRAALRSAFSESAAFPLVVGVDHATAHAASAHLLSPFAESVLVVVDDARDATCTAWGVGQGTALALTNRTASPSALGSLYTAVTRHLGFLAPGDEYKVMGLAPYGQPAFEAALAPLLALRDNGTFALDLAALEGPALHMRLGPARTPDAPLTQRHMDLAFSLQATYERAFFHLLQAAHRAHPCAALSLSGVCAYNSVANGKITERTPFSRVYVQSAAGDAGSAVGAALVVHYARQKTSTHPHLAHAYLGPEFSDAEIGAMLTDRAASLRAAGVVTTHHTNPSAMLLHTADALAQGKVVGWFQGRMEWGPRALGNRSILGDPRRADMKDILNLKIKRRESFRPFAPSVLREHVAAWFERDDDVPFMMKVLKVRTEWRHRIPAVTHVDGSGRLQTVYADANPRFHALISAFLARTGVPMLLNTSFNENEPVVCRPEEALDCFLRTHMDIVVLGDYVLTRPDEKRER